MNFSCIHLIPLDNHTTLLQLHALIGQVAALKRQYSLLWITMDYSYFVHLELQKNIIQPIALWQPMRYLQKIISCVNQSSNSYVVCKMQGKYDISNLTIVKLTIGIEQTITHSLK